MNIAPTNIYRKLKSIPIFCVPIFCKIHPNVAIVMQRYFLLVQVPCSNIFFVLLRNVRILLKKKPRAPAPPSPPGGDCSDYTLIHPADVLRVMLNYFSLLLTVNPFFSCRRPSENISLEFLRWTSSSEVIVIFKSIYLYDPSKTTADVLLKKSLQKFSYRNHHVMHPRFFGQFG